MGVGKLRRFLLSMACLLAVGSINGLLAQTASIRGAVTDQSHAAMPGVSVKITNVATGVAQSVETNEQGSYFVPFLTPGTYRVEAFKAGFSSLTRDNLKLDVEQTARVDFVLDVGAVSQTVDVSAATALIDSQTSVVGQVIANKSIVELPLNGRNYLELARLTAGVVSARGSRGEGSGAFRAGGQHGPR